jgi:ribosomal protein S18 acetylase RimI-like enzyme
MSIRKYQAKDKKSLIALWQRVFPDDPPHNEPSQVISAKLKVDDLIFISEKDNQIVGACMAGYDGHRGWLYAVAVSPEHRRAGTGTSLVFAALEELKKLGCIKVNLQIRSTNTAVAEFYKSLGFSAEDRLSMGVFTSDAHNK